MHFFILLSALWICDVLSLMSVSSIMTELVQCENADKLFFFSIHTNRYNDNLKCDGMLTVQVFFVSRLDFKNWGMERTLLLGCSHVLCISSVRCLLNSNVATFGHITNKLETLYTLFTKLNLSLINVYGLLSNKCVGIKMTSLYLCQHFQHNVAFAVCYIQYTCKTTENQMCA